MISVVTKADGTIEPFAPTKLNKWAEYATKRGGSWSEIALETVKRLEDGCTTRDIHQTMIDVCLAHETLKYSRIAARLEFASTRKNLDRCHIKDTGSFEDIYNFMIRFGIWDNKTMPRYNSKWEELYTELRQIKMEYWQIKQWNDKYSLKFDGEVIETPQIGAIGLALALHTDTELAYKLARAIVYGKANLPTPILNGCRNGDFNSISCCLISGGDTVDSIGVAGHIAYSMTAKKAGIGIEFETRSKGDDVKGGRVKHLGKHGIYKALDAEVKMFTQITRGGSATVTYKCIDPEIEDMLLWKTQKVDIERRIDKLDYSFAYNDAFVECVIKDKDWYLFSLTEAPELHKQFHVNSIDYQQMVYYAIQSGSKFKKIKARDLLKLFLTSRQETGRIYCVNLTRMNEHTGHEDVIRQSNLCMEIALPTKPYVNMTDLYKPVSEGRSEGETAFCAIAAVNVSKIEGWDDLAEINDVLLRTVDRMVLRAPMMSPQMKQDITDRLNVGIGITGLAGYLYKRGLDYDGSAYSLEVVGSLAEQHYKTLLIASQKIALECRDFVKNVDFDWLPIDTMVGDHLVCTSDWEELRGKPRRHSTLVAHMPTESSAMFSDATNGLYPVRNKVIYKSSRKGSVQYLAPEGDYMSAWEVDNIDLAKYYGVIQNFTDQAISADYYVDFNKFPDGKVPMSQLMKEWVAQAKLGNKTCYYININDTTGGTVQDKLAESLEEDCETCKL